MNTSIDRSVINILASDSTLSDDTICKISNGFYISHDDETFILTCFHSVSSHVYVDDCRQTKLAIAPEFDLALISGDSKQSINRNNMIFNIKDMGDGTIITRHNNILQFHKAIFNGIVLWSPYNSIPKIPCVVVKCDNISHGISGGIFVKDDKLIGIVSNINLDDELIHVIPSFVIMRFVSEFCLFKKYNGICSIVAKIDTVSAEIGDNEEYMIMIDNCFDINYNNHSTNNGIGWNLKNKDLIISIDDNKFDERCCLLCEHISMPLPFDTYIALHFKAGDMFNVSVYREKNDDYKKISFKMSARPLNTILQTPIIGESIERCGIVFSELSLELINKFDLKVKSLNKEGSNRLIVVTDILTDRVPGMKKVLLSKKSSDIWKCIKKNNRLIKTLNELVNLELNDVITLSNDITTCDIKIC